MSKPNKIEMESSWGQKLFKKDISRLSKTALREMPGKERQNVMMGPFLNAKKEIGNLKRKHFYENNAVQKKMKCDDQAIAMSLKI